MNRTESPEPPSLAGRALDRLATRVLGLVASSTPYTIGRGAGPDARRRRAAGRSLPADGQPGGHDPGARPLRPLDLDGSAHGQDLRGPRLQRAVRVVPRHVRVGRRVPAHGQRDRRRPRRGGLDARPALVHRHLRHRGRLVPGVHPMGPAHRSAAGSGRGRGLHLPPRLRRARVGDRRLPARLPGLEPHDRPSGGGWGAARVLPHGHRGTAQRQGDGRTAAGAGRPDPSGGSRRLVSGLGHPARPERQLLGADGPEHRPGAGGDPDPAHQRLAGHLPDPDA